MAEPVSLEECRKHLRLQDDSEIYDDSHDGLLDALIVAAREYVENHTGLVLTRREIVEPRHTCGRSLALHAWPIESIEGIDYTDTDRETQTLPTANWLADLLVRPARIYSLGSWPSQAAPGTSAVVHMTAGYATPDAVPQSIKQAMLLLIGHWFAVREAVNVGNITSELPFAVEALLRSYRIPVIG